MQLSTLEKSSLTRIVLIFFLIGAGFILLFDVAEQLKLVSEVTESVGRLCMWVLILGLVALLARRIELGKAVWLAGSSCGLFIVVGLTLGVTKDIPQLDAVPLVGHDSAALRFIEKFATCGWTCSILLLVFYLVRSLERGQQSLQQEVLEKTQALNRLQKAERQAIQKERLSALGQMASGIAHDLNNALSPVVMSCELLQAGVAEEERDKLLENIVQGSLHAAALVRKLQFFYCDAEAANPRESVNLVAVVRETISLTKPKWHDEAVHHGVDISIALDLPAAAHVLGDAVELKQLLTNLLFNAIDAVPDGGSISVRVKHGHSAVTLEVEDDGVGMTEEVRLQCFEPFFTQKAHKGSGLGLSVCHGIVKRHNATISVETEVGKGTRFMIKLPAGQAVLDSAVHTTLTETGLGKRILYIDDEKNVRESMARLLRALGAHVDVAGDGVEGVNMMCEGDYDVVMTDLGMSGMQGGQVLQAARAYDGNLPVVVVSGWSALEVASELDGLLQPDRILQKPITMAKVQHALTSLGTAG